MDHEQTILVAYTIAKIAVEQMKKKGSMAAVGLSWEAMEEKLKEMDETVQKGTYIGCNNSQDTVTLSGWSDSIQQAMEHLKKDENVVFP